jgi:hypothetical protein
VVGDQLERRRVAEGRALTPPARGASPLLGTGAVPALTAGAGLLAVVFTVLSAPGSAPWWGICLLVASVLVAELRPVHLGWRGERQSFTLTEGPLVVALVLVPGREVVLSIALAVLLAQATRRLPPYKALFNVAQLSAAAALAVWVVGLHHSPLMVVAAAYVFAAVNETLVHLVLWAATGGTPGASLRERLGARVLHLAAVASTALLLGHVAEHEPLLIAAFAGPATLLLRDQERRRWHQSRNAVVHELATQAASLYRRSSDETLLLVLRTARQVLAADDVELLLVDGERLVHVSDRGRGLVRRPRPTSVLASGWAARVLASAVPVAGRSEERWWAGAPVGRERPLALLRVWRDGAQEPFRTADLELLATLVETVTDWVDGSTVAHDEGIADLHTLRRRATDLGRLGEGVIDALDALSSVRQRLSSPAPIRRTDIVEDVRSAERRVSDLLVDLLGDRAEESGQEGQDAPRVVTGRWTAAGP